MIFRLKRKIKFLFQRLSRGFDDSDTWDLQDTFYRWLLPRLRRFRDVTCAYPMHYKNHGEWLKELNTRICQLTAIVNVNELDFEDRSYIPKEELKKWEKVGAGDCSLNALSYDYCVRDFNKWFCENIGDLWW